jgi:hypothetical protein
LIIFTITPLSILTTFDIDDSLVKVIIQPEENETMDKLIPTKDYAG